PFKLGLLSALQYSCTHCMKLKNGVLFGCINGAILCCNCMESMFPFARGELCRRVRFDMRGRDVIVFLHIQKTGGTTFGRHLVRNIRLEQPCYCRAGQKKCSCHRPGGDKDTWLFSRFSTGWSCGLHADWTELTSCVPAAMERRGCAGNRTLRSVPAAGPPRLEGTAVASVKRNAAGRGRGEGTPGGVSCGCPAARAAPGWEVTSRLPASLYQERMWGKSCCCAPTA
uniref:Heparan-sulfate 6-O-sulfotransferase n=1 Tax=Dromaius novaehollandiae TaxID=8790 RepID=A0A8C4J614_DRONO